jgi:bifunctional enzyme CysN/CysC
VLDLLRLVTAGSVDSGKSTLIGRLLFDSKQIYDDQLAALQEASIRRSRGFLDLSLLTDGLRAEREQGITIDVAYRYVSTPRRKFVIADTPGHVQYTRNMVTGASTAALCVLVVEVDRGQLEQTRRHLILASLVGVRNVVIAVNKMDVVGYDQAAFLELQASFADLLRHLPFEDVRFIPVSALNGDNIVRGSDEMPWYDGLPLLEFLETVEVRRTEEFPHLRLPVQLVLRPDPKRGDTDRFYAGRLAAGSVRVGDPVTILPSGAMTRIRSIVEGAVPVAEASAPGSVAVSLEDDIDVSRGYMIADAAMPPETLTTFDAVVCWLGDRPLQPGARYAVKHTSAWSRGIVESIEFRYDVNDLTNQEPADALVGNDIGCVRLVVTSPLFADPYRLNRTTGSFILVDEGRNDTVAAGMIGGVSG